MQRDLIHAEFLRLREMRDRGELSCHLYSNRRLRDMARLSIEIVEEVIAEADSDVENAAIVRAPE